MISEYEWISTRRKNWKIKVFAPITELSFPFCWATINIYKVSFCQLSLKMLIECINVFMKKAF